jgi:hypothetical protein
MNTRRSSPLPDPNDNYQRYEINYKKYYLDSYNNVIYIIEKE